MTGALTGTFDPLDTACAINTLRHSLTLPSDSSLIDLTIYQQGYAIAPGANPLGLVLSNGIAWTIQGA